MQCLRRCFLAFLAVCAALAAVAAIGGYYAASWLNDPDVPGKAAAIVVLGGDSSRAFEAADLYRAGLAPRIYVSAPIREARERLLESMAIMMPKEEETVRRVLVARGVPDGAIEVLARDMISTVQEAKATAQRLAGVPGTVLIVTSPYHVRRTRMIFGEAMPGRDLRVVANRYEPFTQAWWTDQTAARNVVLEVAKTAFYLLGGRFWATRTSTRQS
jgi:uncharacterized SAM-binding protein YcdF (DUF218 family)